MKRDFNCQVRCAQNIAVGAGESAKSEFYPRAPHGGRRELIATACLFISTSPPSHSDKQIGSFVKYCICTFEFYLSWGLTPPGAVPLSSPLGLCVQLLSEVLPRARHCAFRENGRGTFLASWPPVIRKDSQPSSH